MDRIDEIRGVPELVNALHNVRETLTVPVDISPTLASEIGHYNANMVPPEPHAQSPTSTGLASHALASPGLATTIAAADATS